MPSQMNIVYAAPALAVYLDYCSAYREKLYSQTVPCVVKVPWLGLEDGKTAIPSVIPGPMLSIC